MLFFFGFFLFISPLLYPWLGFLDIIILSLYLPVTQTGVHKFERFVLENLRMIIRKVGTPTSYIKKIIIIIKKKKKKLKIWVPIWCSDASATWRLHLSVSLIHAAKHCCLWCIAMTFKCMFGSSFFCFLLIVYFYWKWVKVYFYLKKKRRSFKKLYINKIRSFKKLYINKISS